MRKLYSAIMLGLLLGVLLTVFGRDRGGPGPRAIAANVDRRAVLVPRPETTRLVVPNPADAEREAQAALPRRDLEPVVVTVEFHQGRGPCIFGPDGSVSCTFVYVFNVLEVVRGHLNATSIRVGSIIEESDIDWENLKDGEVLNLSLHLSDRSRAKDAVIGQEAFPWLTIESDEAVPADMP